jgi:glycosyltransferase involved in cell wall biosynthesis
MLTGIRATLAYPGNMAHAQNVALGLFEAGLLKLFVTSYSWRSDGLLGRTLERLPGSAPRKIVRQLARNAITTVPPQLVRNYPLWELLRLAAASSPNPILADRAWDWASHRFDSHVARQYVPETEIIQAFEYTALSSFRRAAQLGIVRILHLPSLDSRKFEEIKRREKRDWPELLSPADAYFDAKFERRYARRCAEIAMANVIIANSSLTARSHISAGADPAKVRIVPLAAPPTIEKVDERLDRTKRPLKIVWAGQFSLGKGAHYLLDAWRQLGVGVAARLDIYGRVTTPKRVVAGFEGDVVFHGSVPRATVFEAFEAADMLVFPTLSDGFGMVVTEAFACGLPVITTDQAGAGDLVTSDNGLIVPAGDSKALAGALQWCLDNRPRLVEMRAHALETARQRQWSDFRRDLIAAFCDGLGGAG